MPERFSNNVRFIREKPQRKDQNLRIGINNKATKQRQQKDNERADSLNRSLFREDLSENAKHHFHTSSITNQKTQIGKEGSSRQIQSDHEV